MRRGWVLLALACAALGASCRSAVPGREVSFELTPVFGSWLYSASPIGPTFGFYLYLPEGYDSSFGEYPLILYLQGWGNFGREPNPQLLSSGPLSPLYESDESLDPDGREALDGRVRNSIVVAPRLPYYDSTYRDPQGYYDPDTVHTVVDYVMTNYRVDTSRVYATGLSEGGGGVWGYAWRHPGTVAALVPVSSGLVYPVTDALRSLPVWMSQSYDDTVVPHAQGSDAAFQMLTGVANVLQGYPNADATVSYSSDSGRGPWVAGASYPAARVAYTLYASGGHDAWTRTYANADLWEWLFDQHR